MVVSSRISAQCIEAVSNPSKSPTPPPTTKPDKARRGLTRKCIHNSPEMLSSMNELTTARGEGRKRLGRIPAEDAHCQTINSEMGNTQGKACFARTLGRSWVVVVDFFCPWFMVPRSALGSRRRSLQGRIAHINVLGDQLEVVEGVRDSLLLRKHRIADWRHTVAAPRQCQLKRRLIQTDLRLQCCGCLLRIRFRPLIHGGHFLQDYRNHICPLRGIGSGSKKKLVIADYTVAIGENASAGLPLSGRKKRLPDRPGVHAAALEGRSRIRRCEEDRVYIVVVDSCPLQQLDQQKMNVRAFVERNFLALEFRHRLDGRILGNQNGLSGGSSRVIFDVKQSRCVRGGGGGPPPPRRTEVDAAHVQTFEQLRTRRKFGPFDFNMHRR